MGWLFDSIEHEKKVDDGDGMECKCLLLIIVEDYCVEDYENESVDHIIISKMNRRAISRHSHK